MFVFWSESLNSLLVCQYHKDTVEVVKFVLQAVPVVMQPKVPAVRVAQKTVEIPQAQVPDKVVDVPVVVQHQVPTFAQQQQARATGKRKKRNRKEREREREREKRVRKRE